MADRATAALTAVVRILYYVTGHGYGHATRSAAVMNALFARRPDLQLYIRTQAPEWVFRTTLTGDFRYEPVSLDAGMVEKDLLAQDAAATLQRCIEVSRRAPELVAGEVAFICEQPIDCIVSDIPPLASAIGRAADTPVVAIGNFSWDYIYQPFLRDHPGFAPVIDEIRSWYRDTDLLLRLPWNHEMDAFPVQEPIPLVTRTPSAPRAEARRRLAEAGVDLSRPLVLLGGRFPELSAKVLNKLLAAERFTVLAYSDPGVGPASTFHVLGSEWQPHFVDVLHASDAVVSKLGYGIAAECVACRTPILYPPREEFAEHPFIEADLPRHVPTQRIERAQFELGEWVEPLESLLSRQTPPAAIRTDGAAVAAERILAFAGN
ncbi:MAG: glycosyltransferase family protein [Actinomycetota bacterium]